MTEDPGIYGLEVVAGSDSVPPEGGDTGEYAIVSRPGHSSWCGTAGRLEELLGVDAVPLGSEGMPLGQYSGLTFVDVVATAERAGYDCALDESGVWRLKQCPQLPASESALAKAGKYQPPVGYGIAGHYMLGDLRVWVAERVELEVKGDQSEGGAA